MAKNVLIVDDDVDLRDSLCDLLEMTADAKCVSIGSLRELQNAGVEATNCEFAILDINLGADEPSGIEIYNWLRALGFRGKAVFLTGHADDHPLVIRASQESGAPIYKKPMEIDQLLAMVGRN